MNIKLKRISMGLTQKELAHKVGISHVTLSRIEKGAYENITLIQMKNNSNLHNMHFRKCISKNSNQLNKTS
ncbi:MAG: helix-turn-helix transcriptional regulator [Clostridium perfringens]|nr:helix-turn-helix transcriptional regulator [Clostridium perfringens]